MKKIYDILKRLFDIIFGIVGFIVLIPLTIIVFILNLINKENGPIFYKQKRIGKNGKYFNIYKYRSMIIGADENLKEYLESHPNESKEFKKYRKLNHDPRITKTGKFLRDSSLDELPQVINLLNGTMTLIGPRPYLPEEKYEMTEEEYKKIISVKPGITGYWQVSGRSKKTFKDRVKFETEYIDKRTLALDFKIFFKTFAVVLKREGAR